MLAPSEAEASYEAYIGRMRTKGDRPLDVLIPSKKYQVMQ
jgi:hypothetical protein